MEWFTKSSVVYDCLRLVSDRRAMFLAPLWLALTLRLVRDATGSLSMKEEELLFGIGKGKIRSKSVPCNYGVEYRAKTERAV